MKQFNRFLASAVLSTLLLLAGAQSWAQCNLTDHNPNGTISAATSVTAPMNNCLVTGINAMVKGTYALYTGLVPGQQYQVGNGQAVYGINAGGSGTTITVYRNDNLAQIGTASSTGIGPLDGTTVTFTCPVGVTAVRVLLSDNPCNDKTVTGANYLRMRCVTCAAPPAGPTTPGIQAVSLSAPASGAVSQNTANLTLSWLATGLAPLAYNLYLDASNGTTLFATIPNGITSYTIPPTTPLACNTTYTWRVVPVNCFGEATLPTSCPPFSFTTFSGAPTIQPTLSVPANNATGVALNSTLSWGAVTGASLYDVYLDAVDGTTLFRANVPATSLALFSANQYYPFIPQLQCNTTYYWKVVAKNACGNTLPITFFTSKFTTINAVPACPTLTAPANASTNVAQNPVLTWAASTNAVVYDIYLDTLSGASAATTLLRSNWNATTYTIAPTQKLLCNKTYSWKVVAKNNCGQNTGCSVFQFTTLGASAPSCPTLTAPANASIGNSTVPTLSWAASTGAVSYDIYLDTLSGANAATTLVQQDWLLTSYALPAAAPLCGTTYSWKVVAKNSCGNSTGCTPFTFSILNPVISCPVVTAPANASIGVSLTPTISWTAVTGALFYDVYLDNAGGTTLWAANVGATSIIVPSVAPLLCNTLYTVRVVAKNMCGASVGCTSNSFTTLTTAPTAPTLSVPASGSTVYTPTPALSWAAGTNVTSYNIYLEAGAVPLPSTLFATLPGNIVSFSIPNASLLSCGSQYSWRVEAFSSCGVTSSSTFTFTVSAPITNPVTFTPANLATNVSTTPLLSWTSVVTGATAYDIYLCAGVGCSPVLYKADVPGTQANYQVPFNAPLACNTQHTWRVVPKNSCGPIAVPMANITFTTVNPVTTTCATLSSPANASAGVSVTPTLSWSAPISPNLAQSFDLYLDNATGTTFIANLGPLPGSATPQISYPWPQNTPLACGTTYTWRVVPRYCGAVSTLPGSCTAFTFTTINTSATVPTITSVPAATALAPICGSGTAVLTATGAPAQPGYVYQWQSAPAAVGPWSSVVGGAGATTTVYQSPVLNTTSFYRFVATPVGIGPCTPTTSGVYTVNVAAPPTVSITPPTPVSYCNGAPTATAITVAVSAGTPTVNPAATVSGAFPSYTLTPTATTTYTVSTTDPATACVATATKLVFVGVPIALGTSANPLTVCNNGSTVLTASDTLTSPGVFPTGYVPGTSIALGTADDEIMRVEVVGSGLNNSSTCATTGAGAINGLVASALNRYSNYTNLTPITLTSGSTYTANVDLGNCGVTAYSMGVSLWIDLNRNGVLDVAERLYGSPSTYAGPVTPGPYLTHSFSFSIPAAGVVGGPTLMRVMVLESITGNTHTQASTSSFAEVEDYWVNLNGPNATFINSLPNSAFTWSSAPALSIATNPNRTVTASGFTTATTFTVTATDAGGCTATSTRLVDLAVPIVATGTTGNTSICSTVPSTSITVTTSGGSTPFKTIWTGGPITTPTVPTCIGVSGFAGAYAPANWTITQSNSNGSVNTAGAPASIQLVSSNGLSGAGTTDYNIPINCSGNVTFNWSYTTVDGAQYDYPRYRINGNAPVLFPGYNTLGSTNQSGTASIAVNAGDVLGLQAHSVDNVFGSCTITISSFSAPASVNAVNGTTAALNPPVGSTTYTVTAIDACGTTSTTTVTINVGPVVTLSALPATGAICNPGDSVVLTATAAGGTFSWLPTTGLNNPAIASPSATPAATTTYTVTSTANGCVSTATKTVIVAAPIVVSITQNLPNPLCGVTPTLTANATGGGAAGPPANGAKYYIRDADPWGSAAFNTGLNAAFGVGNWTALTYAAANPATIFVPSTQFVYLEGSSGTEASQTSYLAANLPTIEAWVNAGGRLLINRGPNSGAAATNFGFGGVTNNYNSPQGTVNVAAGHPIASGPFTPAGVGPYTGSSYSHAHITGPGITPIITGGGVNVLVEKQWGSGLALFGGYTAPSFHAPAPNAINLFQNWLSYCATAPMGVPYTYSWAPGGSTTQAITATTSGTYTVTVNSPVGCPSGTATIAVTLNPAVTVSPTVTPGAVCPGAPATLNASGLNATNYVWNPGNLNGASQTVNPAASTTYTVTASNAGTGCTATGTVALSTFPAPVFGATTATPALVCPGDTTLLNTSATVTVGAPGPGAYTVTSIPYVPVSPVGPTNAGPTGDDVMSAAIPIGFTFPFYGINQTNVYISTNGFISFNNLNSGCCSGQLLPNATTPNDLIAIGWEDMNAVAGNITYYNLSSPNRFVVQYTNLAHLSASGIPLTGQIVLFQDGTIDTHVGAYGHDGTVSTWGVENSTGTLASTPPGFNSTLWNATNTSYRFSQFTSTPVGTYAWAASAGTVLNPSNQSTQALVPGVTIYTVTATAGNGCTTTSTTTVNLKPLITGTATATPSAICIGGSASLSGSVPPICGGTVSGFTGAYAPVNWTLSLINSAGTVNSAGAPANVILTTGSNITGNPGYTTYRRVVACNGNVNFNWATSTSLNNLPFLGQPQYRVNSGAWTNMPGFNTGGPSMAQSGTASIPVNVNDTLWLATYTLTNDAADAYSLTISNLVAPDLPISGFVNFWDAPTGGTNLGANPTVTPGSVGTVTYYAQWNTNNAMGCTNPTRTPVNITVNGLPAVTATATPAAICAGGSAVLSGGGAGVGATYVWNGPNTNPYTVTPAGTTSYTVTGTDANGCINTASTTVTVNPLPVITALSASANPICPNGTSTLTVAPGLAGGATYCVPSSGNGSGFGDYIASVGGILSNASGPSASPYYNYFLAPSAAVTAGTAYVLNVTVGTYSMNDVAAWIDYDQNGSFDASEKIGESYNIGSNATAVFNFTPPVTALNGTTRLRIREADQGSTNMSPCDPYSFGETEDYNVTISGGVAPSPSFASITWSPATFLNATNAASVTASGVTSTTTYTVQGTDANGCSASSSITLTMTPAPTGNTFGTPIVIGTLPYSTSGDNLLANCWSDAYTGVGNQPSADVFYQFVMPACKDSVNINTCTGSNYDTWIHLLDNAGAMIASNDDNCGVQSNINFSGLTPGATYYVVVEGFNTSSGNYGLSVSAHQSSTLVPASVTASPNPACENATVTLSGSGAGVGGSYVYAGPATVTAGQFTATLAAAGVYTVTATTASGCTATATVNVSVNALPTVTAGSTPSPAVVCAGGSVTLTGGGASTYTWSDGTNTPANNVAFVPAASSTYTVTGTDANGCSATASLPVTVNTLPIVSGSVSPSPICLGASTTFTGAGASNYTWTNGSSNPADATPFTPPTAGSSTYTVTGTDGNGCSNTATVSLVVNSTGVFNAPVTISSSCSGALGASVLVGATGTTGSVTYTVNPSYPAQPVSGIFNGMLGGAAYTVTLSDANGCTNSTVLSGPANPNNGELANATTANTASQPGNTCQGQNQPDGSNMSYYGATCDDLIVSVSDANGGNVLGNVNACVTVLPGVQTYNGQPYLRRWFDITPQNQGPANLVFYFTHEDITGYNANAGAYPQIAGVPATPSNGNTISFLCSQVPQGFLPGAPGANTTVHNVTATWNASSNRWEAPITVSSFSGFYFHTGSVPLPVTLSSFDGRKLNSSNLLEWSTSAELNNAWFNLQYSTNGVDFVDLAKVNSKAPNGNSATALHYSYEHNTPALGHNYYRLQQVDLDGNSTLNAKVVDLIWGANGSTVSLYPNPTKDVLNIDLYTTRVQNTTVKVLDMSGRIVKQIQARSEAGMNKLSISLGDIASGVYTVQVFENDQLSHVGKVKKND